MYNLFIVVELLETMGLQSRETMMIKKHAEIVTLMK